MINAASGELIGGTKTFSWDPHGTTPDHYWIYVGSEEGGSDLHSNGYTGTSITVGGLPTDGRLVHVRLWSLYTGGGANLWVPRDYDYNNFGLSVRLAGPESANPEEIRISQSRLRY
ncbi:MAG: hypothetical protein ACI8T1_002195 [Verrucomicrobiales bacterium]|jgi:hypothetical protein